MAGIDLLMRVPVDLAVADADSENTLAKFAIFFYFFSRQQRSELPVKTELKVGERQGCQQNIFNVSFFVLEPRFSTIFSGNPAIKVKK